MARLGRPGISEAGRQEVWERWRRGESLSEIARAVGKQPGSIHGLIAARGGISPRGGVDLHERCPRKIVKRSLDESLPEGPFAGSQSASADLRPPLVESCIAMAEELSTGLEKRTSAHGSVHYGPGLAAWSWSGTFGEL
jgi:hypothetical protein